MGWGTENMETQLITRFGEPEVFTQDEMPRPRIGGRDILIRVEATSVNPVDVKIRGGMLPPIAPDLPAVLHGDVAGVVEEVGENVAAFARGDGVYACAGGVKGLGGALAEFMIADPDLVAPKPRSLSMAEAAALPLVGITAWDGLIDRARVQAGQLVLVHGGTGGVGQIGIQLAKHAGATVHATVSIEEKGRIARELGADAVINYRDESVADYVAERTAGRGYDVVFDTVGGDNTDHAFEAAALNGTVITTSSSQAYDLSPMHAKGLTLHVVFMLIPMLHNLDRARHGAILRSLARLVDDGAVRPLVDRRRFSFQDVGAAHRLLESGDALGKVVVTREMAALALGDGGRV